jgi:hypothetical protein
VVIGSDGDVARLQGDGVIGEHDAEALLDFLAFLRGEITAAEFDERSRPSVPTQAAHTTLRSEE